MDAEQDKQGFDHPFEPTQNEDLAALGGCFTQQTLVQNEAIGKIEIEKKLKNEDAFFKIAIERAEIIDVKLRLGFRTFEGHH